MTTKVDEEELPAIEARVIMSGLGRAEALEAFQAATLKTGIDRLGMRGLNWLIASVLERHYPADIFPENGKILDMTWRADVDYGPGIDPGVKWIALLRRALEEVNGAE